MDSFFFSSGLVFWFEAADISVFQTSFNAERYADQLIADLDKDYQAFVKNAVIKRKSEFLAGRYCAHQSLASLGFAEGFISVGEGRCPVWPPGILGSISHCHAYALAATAKSGDYFALGLDVENVVDDKLRCNLLKSIVNQDEMFLLRESQTANSLFTLIFSMKESFFKAVYPHVKIFFDFSTISIMEINKDLGRLKFRVNQTVGSIFTAGSVFCGEFKFLDDKKVVTFFQIKNPEYSSSASLALSSDTHREWG